MQIREQNTQQDYFYYLLQNQKNSLLYLNSDNELFSFNQEIEVYKISYPFLEINLTTNENVEQNHPFQLICLSEGQQQRIYNYYNFFLQVLPQNDTNIQIMFNQDFQQYQTLFNYYSYTQFNSFSGQLLNYRPNYNETYLNFQFLTFSKVGEILQIYQLVQLLSIIQTQQQYLIGYGNNTLNLLLCNQKNSTQLQYCQTLDSISFSQNVSSLQVAFSLYPPKILIGLSSNDTIYLFQYQNNSNSSMTQSNYTFEQQFSDFVLTYNSIIVLIQHQEIQILAFNNQNNYTLNQQSINKLFNSIQFNPLQIIVNSQFQSSFLYINNVNDVIIISIDQNSLPIPITTIGVNFTIELINLVSQQLILSLICNNQQNICFQIWNVQQLPKYYYVKNLPSVNFDNNIIIQSDNLFFYVTFSNQTVYVYNPQLSYHMSLYYVLQLNSSIQGSQYLGLQKNSQIEMSLIISNNSLFILSDIQVVNLTIQQQIQTFNNSISYPQFIYNYTITSQLNDTAFQQTPNQSMALYSNFTVLQNLTNISVSITSENIIPESKNFTFPMNLILDRQIGQCYLNNSYDQNKFCQLTQISHQYYNISNIQNYSLITSINNEIFALQNISYIQTVNSDLTPQFSLDYSYLNLSVCDQSTSSNYTLYSICYNDTQFYLLNFTLSQQGNITNLNIIKMPQNFTSFYQMSSILNQFFIVGQEDSKIMYLYWLNQSSNTFQNISNGCQGFSIKQLKQNTFEDIQSQQILIYYVYMSQVNYTIMTIDDQGIKLQNSVTVQLYYCNQQSICFKDNQQQYFGILIIEIELNSVIILVSNINFSCIVITRIIKSKFKNQNTQVGRIYRTIPKYGPYRNTLNSFYQNGVLMQQFSSKNLYYFNIGVYYLNNLLDENLLEPILMQGLIYSKNSYAMVVNQEQQSVTTVYIYNNFIYSYTFSTSWNVSCLLYSDIIYVPIFCQNNFSNGTYLVTFNLPPHFRINFGPSEYSLLAIIFLLLLYFYIRFTQRTKTLEDINSEIEL
ncbi:unnamed protein product [Paramecium sonneborni]|uniref:Transmembrane protein n=1 Tax=Paramecium sonneborni TaxID=65129 RepID=A0A8S1Q8I7_9CILI|nr:unnamed protein product [Paramecium sonneborni]